MSFTAIFGLCLVSMVTNIFCNVQWDAMCQAFLCAHWWRGLLP